MTRTWYWSSRWLPRGWFDALRQLTLFAGAYYAYRIVRGIIDGQTAVAFDHARSVVNLERNMGLFFEPGFQHWALGLPFVVSMGLAILGYLAYPTAPPRMLSEWGFTDTVTNAVGQGHANAAKLLFNPYAAMPSMHVAFALMIAVPAVKLISTRALRVLWLFYPVFVSFVVVVTANHFWLDGAVGAAVAAVSGYAAYALGRIRPAAWAWRTDPAPETAGTGLGAEAPA